MANAARGEVAFGDTGLTLRFTTNAQCEFEDAAGIGFIKALKSFDGGEPPHRIMRAMVWAGLRESKPGLKIEDAGTLIDDVGLQQTMEFVGAAIKAAYPDADDNEAVEKKLIRRNG